MLFCQVLASEVNIGYEDIVNTQVRQVNGKAVRNLSDLTKQIESCKDEYLKFDLEYDQVSFFSCNLQQPSASETAVLCSASSSWFSSPPMLLEVRALPISSR